MTMETIQLPKPRLLIVDDQPVNIRILHELFRHECHVLMATSGEQAIEVSRRELPDLILLDVVMDTMDGHEVCERLKADALTQEIPIIFLTGQSGGAEEARCFELGAVDFISKPIQPPVVRARVKTHLALKLQTDLLRSLVLLDGLTGVANRRKFDADLAQSWRHCQRIAAPFSLVLFDVDYFKRYNDRYGHQAGDQCLQRIAQYLQQVPNRPHDLVARYGGEEFACILPMTALDDARRMAEEMLRCIRELRIENCASDIDSVITLSAGLATIIPNAKNNSADLLAAADQQLYASKAAGRARVSAMEVTA